MLLVQQGILELLLQLGTCVFKFRLLKLVLILVDCQLLFPLRQVLRDDLTIFVRLFSEILGL